MLREKAKASRRQAILQAADRLFARLPYHQVLLEDIAAEAQVAKGTLYLYFENKADLYLTLVVESMTPMIQRLEEEVPLAAAKSAWNAIRLVVDRLLVFNTVHPALQQVLRETPVAAQEAIAGHLKQSLLKLVEQTLRTGIARGEIVDPAPDITADLILGMIGRASQRIAHKRPRWSAEARAEHLLRLFADGLLVKRK
jgi:TetR/AcrR family fatty acid metabolism transcriptional regulator